MINVLCVIAGSIVGGLSRYYLAGLVQRISGSSFPYGTLAVNLTGCLLIGFIASAAGVRFSLNAPARVLLITGFCGAFTTFSAFMVESDFLLKNGQGWLTLLNILISLFGGFALFRFGTLLGKLI